MNRNFEFEPITIVRSGSRSIDLHNAYDLVGFGTDMTGSEAKLTFRRNARAIDPDTLPREATLTCRGNLRVAFNDLTSIAAPLDDQGIEIAYFDDGCDWLSFTDEKIAQHQEPQGLHVSFVNGLAVRIYCDEASLATL